MRKQLTLILLALLACSTLAATVGASIDTTVTVKDPYSQTYGNLGLQSGSYWVGQIPFQVTHGSSSVQMQGYCINFNLPIIIGTTYPAAIAPVVDTAEWRAVSYVLSWNQPTTNSQAAADQVAVWRLLNQTRGVNYFRESWLTQTIDDAGNAVANQAVGKDVVRADDHLNWFSPITANMSALSAKPSDAVVFTVQLTQSDGAPRANVRVLFNVTLNAADEQVALNSTYISPLEAYTDSQGYASVTVTVPADTPLGAALSVSANTKSVWPQHYIDVTDPSIQNLIGTSTAFELTVSTNVCVTGYIHVVPEAPLGALATLSAAVVGFAVWTKIKPKKSPNPLFFYLSERIRATFFIAPINFLGNFGLVSSIILVTVGNGTRVTLASMIFRAPFTLLRFSGFTSKTP
jgi:hypothetical protein